MSFSLRTLFAVVLVAAISTAALLYRTPILSGAEKAEKGTQPAPILPRRLGRTGK